MTQVVHHPRLHHRQSHPHHLEYLEVAVMPLDSGRGIPQVLDLLVQSVGSLAVKVQGSASLNFVALQAKGRCANPPEQQREVNHPPPEERPHPHLDVAVAALATQRLSILAILHSVITYLEKILCASRCGLGCGCSGRLSRHSSTWLSSSLSRLRKSLKLRWYVGRRSAGCCRRCCRCRCRCRCRCGVCYTLQMFRNALYQSSASQGNYNNSLITHTHEVLHSSIWVVIAGSQRPHNLLTLETHLHHILNCLLEFLPG